MNKVKLNLSQSVYLDFLRAISAMAVLFGHAAGIFLPGSLLSKLNMPGIGVFVFFLLSGFLISYSVFRKYDSPDYSFRTFFIDRFCRIYCAFLPALLLVWIIDIQILSLPLFSSLERINDFDWISSLSDNLNLYTGIGNILMLQDFPLFQVAKVAGVSNTSLFIDTFGSAGPFWTISIEWWIYMLFGMVVISHIRDKKQLTLASLALLGLVTIERLYHFVGGPDQCLTMLWALGMIACLFFLNAHRWISLPDKKIRLLSLMVFLFSLLLMAVRIVALKIDGELNILEFQFGVYLATAIFSFLFVLSDTITPPKLFTKVIRFIADYSYSLYLSHFTVITYLYVRFPEREHDIVFFGMAMILSNIVAVLLWFFFERHHRKLSTWLKNINFLDKT
ncbi:MAG: hypothetical protein COB36_03310 [Alphaproteobacteria bacterium]|nr:MAG: hypothetical protein COB36_03310 [Alphaproteobacteria bacterium]